MDFSGKVVLVTGGSRGIGAEVVRQFARRGAKVLFTYKNSLPEAANLEEEFLEMSCDVKGIQLDVTNHNQTIATIEDCVEKYGSIDILINNAGVTEDSFLMFMGEESWDFVLDTNLKGVFNCCKAVVPIMISQKAGIIINISSISGMIGAAGQTNYSASKAGLIGFTRALSKEVARKNIRINAIAPGYIQTDMLDKIPPRIKKDVTDKISCRRLGNVEEVANSILFLASDYSSYIFGQTLVVDGGII